MGLIYRYIPYIIYIDIIISIYRYNISYRFFLLDIDICISITEYIEIYRYIEKIPSTTINLCWKNSLFRSPKSIYMILHRKTDSDTSHASIQISVGTAFKWNLEKEFQTLNTNFEIPKQMESCFKRKNESFFDFRLAINEFAVKIHQPSVDILRTNMSRTLNELLLLRNVREMICAICFENTRSFGHRQVLSLTMSLRNPDRFLMRSISRISRFALP